MPSPDSRVAAFPLRASGGKVHDPPKTTTTMDLQSIIENGSASVTIQITAKDLRDFATHLFEAAVRKAKAEQASADGDEYLSKAEVMELFGVCDTTLWHWSNSHYLKPVKAGRKILYRKRDVMRILSAKEM